MPSEYLGLTVSKEPENFIRLIAAFVVLPAEKLGYDPTMELYDQVTGTATPSYRLSKPIDTKSPYDTRWVITLNNGTQFLTVKTLSIARAGVMRGRGTIVWVVIPYYRPVESRQGSTSTSNVPEDDQLRVLQIFSSSSSLLSQISRYLP